MDTETESSFIKLIWGARRAINQLAWERLRPCNLTPQQARVLLILYSEGRFAQSAIATRIFNDAPTACRIVSNLTRRRLIKRESDAVDRRRFFLRLTPEGHAACEQIIGCMEGFFESIEYGLSADDIALLQRMLCQIMGNAMQATQHPDLAIAAAVAELLARQVAPAPVLLDATQH